MAKKDKKKVEPPEPEVQEEVVATTDLEPEPEQIQWTDTSYSSASFEILPPLPVVVEDKKKKKKKKLDEKESTAKKSTSELFNWSEDSLPIIDSEEALAKRLAEEQVEEKPKTKKGKKAKPKEEIPEFEKPKEWKTMNKKDREKWMIARIEQWRIEKEAEKQAILAGAKEKRIAYARERNEQLARDVNEHDIRRDVLLKTCILFRKYERDKVTEEQMKQEDEEWSQYLRCDGLPDPRVVPQIQTYIHLWEQLKVSDAEELDKRCVEVLPMLEMLEQLVQKTKQFTPRQIHNYNEIRLTLRAQLSETIQLASYFLLRDLEKYLNFESTKLATYERRFNGLRLNIWVAIKQPTRKPKGHEHEPEPVQLTFPSIKVSVTLPKIIDGSCVCVRAARSMIDLLSEASRSFGTAGILPNKDVDLFKFNEKELQDMISTKKQQDDMRAKFFSQIREKTLVLERFLKANQYTKNEKEKEELDNLNMMEPPTVEEPRQCQVTINEKLFQRYLKQCKTRTRAGEVNLRKYRICGGVLNLDLITTPPQPKYMRHSIILTAFQLPKALQAMKYQVQYRAPSPPPPGVTRTPEEIEQEIKKVEAQYEKLALVFIDLPQEVMWTEPPVVCQWQENRRLWTTNYVNDYKFNEDKLTVQFRTGVLWPIGIAVLKYSNLPYQGWDVKPDPYSKGVLVTVTGLCVTVTWLCLGNFVRLKFIANSPTSALREHFNKRYTVKKMVQLMRDAGCDVFPDFDAHNYVEGSSAKEWVMEKHHYHAMAFLSRAYNFQWSRWNAEANSRTMIMQIREVTDPKRQAKLSLLYVTPERAAILKCNEMTQEINYDIMAGFPFYPDLFTLNMGYGSVDARRLTFNMKYRLVETVSDLLQELKLFSFS